MLNVPMIKELTWGKFKHPAIKSPFWGKVEIYVVSDKGTKIIFKDICINNVNYRSYS